MIFKSSQSMLISFIKLFNFVFSESLLTFFLASLFSSINIYRFYTDIQGLNSALRLSVNNFSSPVSRIFNFQSEIKHEETLVKAYVQVNKTATLNNRLSHLYDRFWMYLTPFEIFVEVTRFIS